MQGQTISRFGLSTGSNKSLLLIMAAFLPALLAALALGSVACDYSDERLTLLVTVGSELKDCEGVAPMKCFEVNEQLFYESIEGFDYEEGYVYRLRIERTDLYPGEKEPPQDASRYSYRLIEVVSKTSTAPVR